MHNNEWQEAAVVETAAHFGVYLFTDRILETSSFLFNAVEIP